MKIICQIIILPLFTSVVFVDYIPEAKTAPAQWRTPDTRNGGDTPSRNLRQFLLPVSGTRFFSPACVIRITWTLSMPR